MKWLSAFALAALLTSQPARASSSIDVPDLVNVFVAACSVGTAGNLSATEIGNGVTRQFIMRTGAPPGTQSGEVTFQGQHFSIVAREEPNGFCALRFEPQDATVVKAELERRFGMSSDARGWRVHRSDGDGLVAYRPFAPGLTGPAWINRPGAFGFGFDAAEHADTLIFYAPLID